MESEELLYQSFTETYAKHNCPKCSVTNWTYMGHSDDCFGFDREICKCHSCGQRYWLMSKEQVNDVYGCYEVEDGMTLDECCGAMEVDGRPNP